VDAITPGLFDPVLQLQDPWGILAEILVALGLGSLYVGYLHLEISESAKATFSIHLADVDDVWVAVVRVLHPRVKLAEPGKYGNDTGGFVFDELLLYQPTVTADGVDLLDFRALDQLVQQPLRHSSFIRMRAEFGRLLNVSTQA
jgi:hypothetical protein